MMQTRSEKITFDGAHGTKLDARLDSPVGRVEACALFAHCFTCSKASSAATRISRALARAGIAVLRFDFTGLGGSDGDFANTNFSSNVEDLLAAARFLETRHGRPVLAIGHSLGGTAVLRAASSLSGLRAVVTINAPADPNHVTQLFGGALSEIERSGAADVTIAGRTFQIQKQFLEDIADHHMQQAIAALGLPLLVLHSPADQAVPVDHARRIFKAAKHPKSFVALDEADHLITNKRDANYIAQVIEGWASRYLVAAEEEPDHTTVEEGEVVVTESLRERYLQDICSGRHHLFADEPAHAGCTDLGPSPYNYLLMALGSCTAMTLRMYAENKGIDLQRARVRLKHKKIHAKDCDTCETKNGKLDRIERIIELEGNLTDEQRQRLLQIADKCPVHRTLRSEIQIESRLAKSDV